MSSRTATSGPPARRALPPPVKRIALAVVVSSLLVNAALGIVALLSGDFGDLERRILLTSVCVSVASVLIVACLPAQRARTIPVLPIVGVVAALVAGFLFGIAVWLDDPPPWLLRAGGTALVVAAVGVHGSLLSLIRLRGRFAWISKAAMGLAAALGGLGAALIWSEDIGGSEGFGRGLGVVALLFAVTTVLVPILSRGAASTTAAVEAPPGPGEATPARFCPACGSALEAEPGRPVVCPHCSARFWVDWIRD